MAYTKGALFTRLPCYYLIAHVSAIAHFLFSSYQSIELQLSRTRQAGLTGLRGSELPFPPPPTQNQKNKAPALWQMLLLGLHALLLGLQRSKTTRTLLGENFRAPGLQTPHLIWYPEHWTRGSKVVLLVGNVEGGVWKGGGRTAINLGTSEY